MFNEYFHGDNGAGLGASHQTGWTGVVADLIRGRPGDGVLHRRRAAARLIAVKRGQLDERTGDADGDAAGTPVPARRHAASPAAPTSPSPRTWPRA